MIFSDSTGVLGFWRRRVSCGEPLHTSPENALECPAGKKKAQTTEDATLWLLVVAWSLPVK